MSVAEVLLRIRAQGYEKISDIADDLEEVEEQSKRTTKAQDNLGESAGRVGQGAQKMAGSLGLISPAAQSAAMVVADLADVVEVGGSALSIGAVSMLAFAAASVASVAAVVAAAAGVVALTRSSAEALPALLELQKASGVELVPAATIARIEGAAGALDAAEAGFQAAGASIASAFAPQLREAATLSLQMALALRDVVEQGQNLGAVVLGLGVSITEGLLAPLRTMIAALAEMLDGAARAASAIGKEGLAAQLKEAGAALRDVAEGGLVGSGFEALTEGLQGYRGEAEKIVGAQVVLNRNLDTTTDKLDEQRDALFAALDLWRKWEEQAAEIELAPGTTDIRKENNPLLAQLDALAPATEIALSKFEELRLLEIDISTAFEQGTITAQQKADALNRIADAYDRLRMSASQQLAATAGLVSAGAGALNTATSGSIGGMAQSFGPAIGTAVAGPVGAAVGTAVGDALSALEALGAAGGAEGVQAKLEESLANISLGIETLPDLLSDVAPDLIASLISQLVPALLKLQAQLFVELQLIPLRMVQGFVQGFDEWWSAMGGLEGLADAVWSGMTSWWENAWTTITGFFRELFGFSDKDQDGKRGLREVGDSIGDFFRNAGDYIMTGSYATGADYVPRTGMYKLHQGERVTPAHLAGGGSGGEGGGVTINLSGFAIGTPDQLVRELNRALGDAGRRLAWRA